MAAALAAAVGGSSISAASQLGASLGTASIQSNTAMKTNTQNLDFQKSMIDRGESSYTEVGMPRYMFWGGNSSGVPSIPHTLIPLGGQNFYEQSGVNANLPYFTSSPYSQFTNSGTPNSRSFQKNSMNNTPTPTPRQNFVPGLGQTDRTGLGAGRYSAVPPPTLTYNSVATGTNVSTYNKSIQNSPRMMTSYSQTGQQFTQNKYVQTYNPYKWVSNT